MNNEDAKKTVIGVAAVVSAALAAGYAVRRRNQWRREHPIEWRKDRLEKWAGSQVHVLRKKLDLTLDQADSMKNEIVGRYEKMRHDRAKLHNAEAAERLKLKHKLHHDSLELKDKILDILTPPQRVKLGWFNGFRIDVVKDNKNFGFRQHKA